MVDVGSAVSELPGWSPQRLMSGIIGGFEAMPPEPGRLLASGRPAVADVVLDRVPGPDDFRADLRGATET